MHDETKTGTDYFVCDFCLRSWREDLQMVEGHRGSLICSECLARALAEIEERPVPRERVTICAMCQEHREEPYWMNEASDALICVRCAVKSAGVLEKG